MYVPRSLLANSIIWLDVKLHYKYMYSTVLTNISSLNSSLILRLVKDNGYFYRDSLRCRGSQR